MKGEIFEKLFGAHKESMYHSFLYEYVNPQTITILDT